MKIRTKYILFVVLIHGAALTMSYFIFEQNKLWFLLAEFIIFCSIMLSWSLYNQMVRPMRMLAEGAKAIADQDFTVKLVETGTQEMDQLIVVYNQMIEALRKERTKQQQQHFFLEKLILNSPVGILILDHDKRIQQVNPAAKRILHMITAEGWLLRDIDHPIFHEISNLFHTQQQSVILSGAETYKIQLSAFIDQGFPRHFVIIQELTAELLEAEKMAYGKVIRMMAHEVNNTIGPVNSILQSAHDMQIETQTSGSLINALQVAMDRNNNLNRFMRNLADVVRLPEPRKKMFDLQELIHTVCILFAEQTKRRGIDFTFDFESAGFPLYGDPLQMEQVLINIVKNSIEAIDATHSGEISFLTKPIPGLLLITDNGKGIDPQVAPHLFSPFYSTKTDGQGIGLTLIKDILINHGFAFGLSENAAGKTEFKIEFSS